MRFSSKKALIESIEASYDELVSLAGSIPAKRYAVKGVWGDEWTIKNLFAHPELNQVIWRKRLLSPGDFAWAGKLQLSSYLAPCTSSHYRAAMKFLKRWLRKQRAAD